MNPLLKEIGASIDELVGRLSNAHRPHARDALLSSWGNAGLEIIIKPSGITTPTPQYGSGRFGS